MGLVPLLSALSLVHEQGHRRLKVQQANREVMPMEVCCRRLPVIGLIRVLLGSPSHREDVMVLKEPSLLWNGRGKEDRVWSC